MRKILEKVILLLFIFYIFSSDVLAITCDYPSADLSITYDENSTNVDYDKFAGGQYYVNLLLFSFGNQTGYNRDSIIMDDTLYQKYHGSSCPTNMYVCEYNDFSVSSPSGASVVGIINPLFTCLGGDQGACQNALSESYSFASNDRKLHILTYEEYQNSDIKKYEGGVVSSESWDYVTDGYNACNLWGLPVLGWITGGICGTVYSAARVGLWENIFGDGVDMLYFRNTSCSNVQYEGPYASFDVNCKSLETSLAKYIDNVEKYKSCEGDYACKRVTINELNDVESQIKNVCYSIMQNFDYNDTQKYCLDSCFEIDKTLNEYKKGTDLYSDWSHQGGNCNVSNRIINWIANIMKWMKYIAPVLVIILSMVDFIKAIASNSDEEVKKTQGKFVKRLIAAALLFIIPFIIQFVLETFKLTTDYCGLI